MAGPIHSHSDVCKLWLPHSLTNAWIGLCCSAGYVVAEHRGFNFRLSNDERCQASFCVFVGQFYVPLGNTKVFYLLLIWNVYSFLDLICWFCFFFFYNSGHKSFINMLPKNLLGSFLLSWLVSVTGMSVSGQMWAWSAIGLPTWFSIKSYRNSLFTYLIIPLHKAVCMHM